MSLYFSWKFKDYNFINNETTLMKTKGKLLRYLIGPNLDGPNYERPFVWTALRFFTYYMIIFGRLKLWTALIMDDCAKIVRIRAVQIRADKVV